MNGTKEKLQDYAPRLRRRQRKLRSRLRSDASETTRKALIIIRKWFPTSTTSFS